MTSWQQRESDRQARSREQNEWTAHARADTYGWMSTFRCECGAEACTCPIRLTLGEYESVRAYATRFAIARDHENPEIEQVISEDERFAVVEIVSGEAAKLARRSYPRQWPGHMGQAPPTGSDRP